VRAGVRSLFGFGICREEFGLRRGGTPLAAAGTDETDDFEGMNRRAGHVDALRVGTCVGRSEEEAGALNQGTIVGCEAFEFVAVGESHAEPQAAGAGPYGEALLEETFRICLLAGRKVADITDPFDGNPFDREDLAGEIEDLEGGGILSEDGAGVTGDPVAGELTHNHGFTRGRHCNGLSHERRPVEGEKAAFPVQAALANR